MLMSKAAVKFKIENNALIILYNIVKYAKV